MCGIENQILDAITPVLRKYYLSHEDFFKWTINKTAEEMPPEAMLALDEILCLSIITAPDMMATHFGYNETQLRSFQKSAILENLLMQQKQKRCY
jgi:hypothetical protein